jgi:hypothetical protein
MNDLQSLNKMFVSEVNDLSDFNLLPKSLKKTLRYIKQDVHFIDKLAQIQKILNVYIDDRKKELQDQNDIYMQKR